MIREGIVKIGIDSLRWLLGVGLWYELWAYDEWLKNTHKQAGGDRK